MPLVPGEFRTFRGHYIQIQDPDPRHIDIRDIARGLAHEGRYANQVTRRLCVAEHSCHIHDIVPEALRLPALLHDATEAYLRDLPKPIKMICPDYEVMEDAFWLHVARRFDLDPVIDPLIKKFDVAIRNAERRVVYGGAWDLDPILGDIELGLADWSWNWQRAEAEFLQRFQKLLGDDWVKYTWSG